MNEQRSTGFAWTPEEFDRQMIPQLVNLLVMVQVAKYRVEDRGRPGAPDRSAQAEIDILEKLVAARELRLRAADGDRQALRELVDEAARAELACERLERENELKRAQIAARAR